MIARRNKKNKTQINRGKRRKDAFIVARNKQLELAEPSSQPKLENMEQSLISDLSSSEIIDPLIGKKNDAIFQDLTKYNINIKEGAENISEILFSIVTKIKSEINTLLATQEWVDTPLEKKLKYLTGVTDAVMKIDMVVKSRQGKDQPTVRHDHFIHPDTSIEELQKKHDELAAILGRSMDGKIRREVHLVEEIPREQISNFSTFPAIPNGRTEEREDT